jgi:bile acid-coenzyme A ligase
MAVGAALDFWCERDPDAVWLVEGDREVTRAELAAKGNQVARVLVDAGVGPGSLVTVALPNGIEFVQAVAGIWKAGGTPQLVSARMPQPERDAVVELADPPVIFGVERGEYPGRQCLPPGWTDGCGGPTEAVPVVEPAAFHAPCSGGSTGRPKIIVTGRPGAIDPLSPVAVGTQVEGCQLIAGPLYHNGPFGYGMSALLTGNKMVIMPRFDARQALELIGRHRVDWVPLVPTMMQRIIRLGPDILGQADLSSLSGVMHFGAVCPAWLKQAWIDLIGPDRVFEVYGGAEGQAVTVITGREWLEHPGSVGRAYVGRFRVLDDDGNELPPGEIGELFMMPDAGPGSTYRYIGAEAKERGGWESLGDMGSIDADGWVYLADRRKDLIVTGGANVYPAEVEGILDAHPAVVTSAVVGEPDDDLGERVHAFVELDQAVDADELTDWVSAQLARYKVPRAITVVDGPVRDEAGKVRRSALLSRFSSRVSPPAQERTKEQA